MNDLVQLDKPIIFYVIRNKDGQYFRAKGGFQGSGRGKSWVDDLANAKFYGKPGPAKSQITFWAKNYPQYGTPVLIELIAGSFREVRQEERVQNSIKKTKIRKKKQELAHLVWQQEQAAVKIKKLNEEQYLRSSLLKKLENE